MDRTEVDISDIVGMNEIAIANNNNPSSITKRDGESNNLPQQQQQTTTVPNTGDEKYIDCLKCCVCLEAMGGISQRKVCLLEPCMHGVCSDCALKVSSFNSCPVCKIRTKAIKRTFL